MKKFETDSDYFKFRHEKIGASDSNIIMGVSKQKTYEDLVIEKAMPYRENNDNSFVRTFGLKEEDEQRENINVCHSLNLQAQLLQHKTLGFMVSALDGFDKDKGIIWEHKVMGLVNGDFQIVEKEKRVPDCYIPQVQHQLFVADAKKMLFQATTRISKKFPTKRTVCFEVERDDEYIQKKLIPTIYKFCADVMKLKATL